MDIWIKDCTRTCICVHCKKDIALHTPMIVGKYWSKNNGISYAHIVHWHVRREEDSVCCWIEQGLSGLKERSQNRIETRGNHLMLIPSEMRSARLKLLQRHARLMQMLREEMEKLATDSASSHPVGSWQRVSLIGLKLESLKAEINLVGGVPASWLTEEEELNQQSQTTQQAEADILSLLSN